MLRRYNASGFGVWEESGQAIVQFAVNDRLVRFVLPLPLRDAPEFRKNPKRGVRSPEAQNRAWEQACRQRWRALALVIKAKLEAVECGISEFEKEFLAFIVDPVSKKTIGDILLPLLAQRHLENPDMPIGLPGPPAN
jgi:hypothetical protein